MSFRIHRPAAPPVGATIELRASLQPRPMISLVVFDFDGTLSWLRHGWPELMIGVFLEQAPERFGFYEPAERDLLLEEILALNGQPSIFQCERLAEMLSRRGGPPMEPEPMRAEFQRRLDADIARRIEQVRSGVSPVNTYLVHGAKVLTEHAAEMGLKLAILSSTAQERVREEAELLGLTSLFGQNIHGSTGDPRLFTKRAVFERLIRESGCPGISLLSFGDGPVELRETKALGGTAIGVCSDEYRNGSGISDPHKRTVLFAAGADAAIPDYRDACQLLDFLLGK